MDVWDKVAEHGRGHGDGPYDVLLVLPNAEVDVLLPQSQAFLFVAGRTAVTGCNARHKSDGAQHQRAHNSSQYLPISIHFGLSMSEEQGIGSTYLEGAGQSEPGDDGVQ